MRLVPGLASYGAQRLDLNILKLSQGLSAHNTPQLSTEEHLGDEEGRDKLELELPGGSRVGIKVLIEAGNNTFGTLRTLTHIRRGARGLPKGHAEVLVMRHDTTGVLARRT
eukprot:10330849-Alexandrium_andersonii.AAC.1